MAFIPVPNTAKATLQWTIYGQIVEITLHFLRTGGWDASSLNSLCANLFSWFTTYLQADLSNQSALVNINATDQSSVSAPSIDYPISGGNVGGNGSTPAPLNATAAVKFNTALRGRSYRGRNYWPVLPNNALTNPLTVSPSYMATMLAAYAALPAAVATTSADHVVVSRYNGGAARTTGVATPVTSYAMDQSVDSQRRRLAGRGI